jgi:hypothetical protein
MSSRALFKRLSNAVRQDDEGLRIGGRSRCLKFERRVGDAVMVESVAGAPEPGSFALFCAPRYKLQTTLNVPVWLVNSLTRGGMAAT